jgi:hypothetical protein
MYTQHPRFLARTTGQAPWEAPPLLVVCLRHAQGRLPVALKKKRKEKEKIGPQLANAPSTSRLIGKLTAFLQLQEFCQRNQIVDSSTTAARLFLLCSNLGLEIFSRRRIQLKVLTLT